MEYFKNINKKSLLVLLICCSMFLTLNFSVYASTEITLPSGTLIYVETTDTLNPANLNTGDDVSFIVYDDIIIEDTVIINAGTPVTGTVTKAQGEGALGKAAELSVKVNSVRAVDGTIIGLSGSRTVAGQDKQTEAVGGGLFLCAPMLLMKGGGAEIPQGSIIECRVMSTKIITVN